MADDILGILLKYNNVAKTLTGHSVLIKDKTMLPFLAYCLSSSDANLEVVELVIETLCLLAINDSNVAQLIETFGVVEAVELTASRHDLPDLLKTKALQLHEKLNCRKGPAYCTRSKTKALDIEHQTQAKITKLITLHVHGMHKESRQSLELALIRVKGVVSVVLDVDHQRCTLRVYESVTPLDIATAVFEETGMEAKLVSRNRVGQEILKPLLETSSNDSSDWPPYLKEEDSPVKDNAVTQMFAVRNKPSHWLNSAVDFLQKSFYW